jgi:hypothetical protein
MIKQAVTKLCCICFWDSIIQQSPHVSKYSKICLYQNLKGPKDFLVSDRFSLDLLDKYYMVHATCTLWPKSQTMTFCGLFYDSVSISDYTMPNG